MQLNNIMISNKRKSDQFIFANEPVNVEIILFQNLMAIDG